MLQVLLIQIIMVLSRSDFQIGLVMGPELVILV